MGNFLWNQLVLMQLVYLSGPCSGFATSCLLNKDSAQQKVGADSLPHVVCLKCDPNEVTGLFSKGLDPSEQLHHNSSYKNKLTALCLHLHMYLIFQCYAAINVPVQDRKGAGSLRRASHVYVEHGVI